MNKKGEVFIATTTGLILLYFLVLGGMYGVSKLACCDEITFKAKPDTVDTVNNPAPPNGDYSNR